MAKDKDQKEPPTDQWPKVTHSDSSFENGGGMSMGVAIVGFLLCFLAGAALMWGYDSHRMKTAGVIAADTSSGGMGSATWSDADSPIPVSSKDPIWGNRYAPVTVVIFSDFQCPFCARVEPTIDQVKSTYGPDKVRIVWKNQPLPMHDKARGAAEAAMTVFALKGSEAFWKFHDLAFQNQQALGPDNYEKWAVAAGVDPSAFKTALAAKTASAKVAEDQQLATKVGVNGTPAFRINGVELTGAQPFDKFKAVIDQELGKAQAKIASGTAKDRVYVETSKENFKAAPAKQEKESEREDSTTVWKVPVGNSPFLGRPDAPVTIVVFSDFQCPFCKRVEPTLDKVRETYGDKVRVVWKNKPLPFHPRAMPAAQLAMEARSQKGDKGFWEAHKRLFASQPKLDDADLEKIATDMGLNVEKVKAAIKDAKYKKEVEADVELGDSIKAGGTPHFFINGRRLVGAQPFEKFAAIIDDEIKKFDDQKGKVAAKEYYDNLMKTAKVGAAAEREPAEREPAELEKKTPPPVPAGAPTRGPANAKVVIQEWSDFECPFCGRVEPTVAEIMKNFGDKVKFVWRDKPLPMHADAMPAAQAAREALKQKGSEGFWKMHGKLFANQRKLQREDLEGYAKDMGLDMEKFKAALDKGTHKAAIEADDKAGSEIGIDGTPAFLINGYYISGAQPYPVFKKAIERALADAKP
ncbi:MAG: thioredoxin domain-containing protein [Polyangiaceae bacterium]|nr:thioredoxin domain-containing protein [Polyangiaceae bacterium]